jgi:predicted phage terminase large subunit-like protein
VSGVNEKGKRPVWPKLTKDVIEGFASSCLTPYFDEASAFADFHRELWDLCCSADKFVAICAPRGHAKSTIITIVYTLAAVLFREREFVVIVADTESQASLFLGQIKQILEDSKHIQELFGLKTNEKGLVYEKDTDTDFIIQFSDMTKFRIIAKGAEQKLRGMLAGYGKRPDLVVIDDLLNEELVANKDRRDKLRRWVYGSLIPCRSRDGIIRFVGTPMNLDDPLESLMPKDNAKTTVVEDLKIWSKRKIGMWKSVKYKAHNHDYSKLLWPARNTKQFFEELKQDFHDQGIPEVYACEYLCNPIDDSIRYFRRGDFLSMTEEDRKKNKTFYITADLAISQKERADYTAIVVGGMDSNGQLHIIQCIRDRLEANDIVTTLLTLQKIYNPIAVGIEDTQITKAIGPYLNRAMQESGTYMNLLMLKPHRQDKIQRARSIQARMRAGMVKFDKSAEWWLMFEDECMSFPRAKHDDTVDALSYQGILIDLMSEGLTKEELDLEQYELEKEEAGFNDEGRDEICGY